MTPKPLHLEVQACPVVDIDQVTGQITAEQEAELREAIADMCADIYEQMRQADWAFINHEWDRANGTGGVGDE